MKYQLQKICLMRINYDTMQLISKIIMQILPIWPTHYTWRKLCQKYRIREQKPKTLRKQGWEGTDLKRSKKNTSEFKEENIT